MCYCVCMQYDLHPIFVHFPIALLVFYSIIKIIPLSRWLPKIMWRDIERFLLVFGTLGAFVSLSTGEIAEEMFRVNHQLVEAHATFAVISVWLYGALIVGEVASFLVSRQFFVTQRYMTRSIAFVNSFLCDGFFARLIAFVAFVSILLTGLLGGVLVYGTTADPLAGFILRILGISI